MFDFDIYRQSVVRHAQWFCWRGIKIFPVTFKSKGDNSVYWKDICTNNFDQFLQTLPNRPVNLAMVFGPDSGIMDIEADSNEANDLMLRLAAESGVHTVAYQSRRGIHRLYKWEPRFAHWNNANPKAGKLDIRMGTTTASVYSVAPPSIHQDTGLPYEWLPGCAPWEIDIAAVPENIIQYCLANVGQNKEGKSGMVLDADPYDDGWLPTEGGRHQYLLGFSKLLYCDMGMPLDDCMELTRYVSQKTGSYYEPGRGEFELKNCFRGLTRKLDPVKQMSMSISMADIREEVTTLINQYDIKPKDEIVPDEIPAHIFHPIIQEASVHAKACEYPRNLWLMTIATSAAFALGTSTQVRTSIYSGTMGLQIYSFGVGGSGQGKSKTMKALLAPFGQMDSLVTDATAEALTSAMVKHPRGVMLELTEGKEFAPMLNRYGTGSTVNSGNALFHKTWTGDRIKVIRQKESNSVENPFLVICAAIQKLNLSQLPQNDYVDGLVQRMVPYPIGSIPKTTNRDSLKEHAKFIREWHDMVARLRSVKAVIGSGAPQVMLESRGGGMPQVLTLTPEAQQVWEDYAAYKRSEKFEKLWPDQDHPWRSDLVRHAEYALRFAGILFQLDQVCNRETWELWKAAEQDFAVIPEDVMRRAIDLMEWLWAHKQIYLDALVEAAFAAASGDSGLKKTESVVTKVEKFADDRRRRIERAHGELWTLRDYYTTLRLPKVEAQKEVDMFVRERRIVQHELKENQKSTRFSFVEN